MSHISFIMLCSSLCSLLFDRRTNALHVGTPLPLSVVHRLHGRSTSGVKQQSLRLPVRTIVLLPFSTPTSLLNVWVEVFDETGPVRLDHGDNLRVALAWIV